MLANHGNGNNGAKGESQPVPFLDLITPHQQLEQELVSVFKNALSKAGFIGGPALEEFEHNFAQYCDTRYCIGVASGTDALRFALTAAGVSTHDAVVTVPNTFIATTEAISQSGAHLEFVDVDERTHNMSPEKLHEFLETKCVMDSATGKPVTRNGKRPVTAIVPVHLFGQPADMDAVLELAARYHLMVIEDACQGHGAEYFSRKSSAWKRVGSMGCAAAFSFYPGKNLGACGEAGAVTTNDEHIAGKIRMLRDHGQSRKYHHEMEGYNGRLDAIQAGILNVKLRYLDAWNEQRRERACRYNNLLATLGTDLSVCAEAPESKSVYHLYVVRVQNRDDLMAKLAQLGIGTGIHYPIPLHLQNAYGSMGYKVGDFPVSERLAKEMVSLPMYPNLTPEQQHRVVDTLREVLSVSADVLLPAA